MAHPARVGAAKPRIPDDSLRPRWPDFLTAGVHRASPRPRVRHSERAERAAARVCGELWEGFSAPAQGVHDFDPVAVAEPMFVMPAAGHDFAVDLDRDPAFGQAFAL